MSGSHAHTHTYTSIHNERTVLFRQEFAHREGNGGKVQKRTENCSACVCVCECFVSNLWHMYGCPFATSSPLAPLFCFDTQTQALVCLASLFCALANYQSTVQFCLPVTRPCLPRWTSYRLYRLGVRLGSVWTCPFPPALVGTLDDLELLITN